MKIFKALCILLTITVIGNLISYFLKGAVPGTVIGMIILFILLITGIVKIDTVRETSLFLVSHLALFVLPAVASVLDIKGFTILDILLFSAVAAVSTIITLFVTAFVTEMLLKAAGEYDID